jgi:hypothetical protein
MRNESYHFVLYCDGIDGKGHVDDRGKTVTEEFSEPNKFMAYVAARAAGWLLGTSSDICPRCAKLRKKSRS